LGHAPLSSGGAGLGIFTPADPNSSVRPRALTRRPRRRPFQGYRLRRRAPGIDPRPAAQPRPRWSGTARGPPDPTRTARRHL